MTIPYPIHPEQPRGEYRNYKGNIMNMPYSPVLARNDFHLFGPQKNHFGGKQFTDDEEVELEMQKCLKQHSKDFCAVGFDTLVK
jgi:hypothetical protein